VSFDGPGKYDAEATELRERLRATGLVLIVRDGVKGEGFEVQLNWRDLVVFPTVLRDLAEQIEAHLMRGPAS
jgi:hypothetical protein